MLRCEGATLDYGSYRALSGVSIHVEAGELVVMLGANGAGKSSLFLAISGLRRLKGGVIRLGERDLANHKPSEIVEAGAGPFPGGRTRFSGRGARQDLVVLRHRGRGGGAGAEPIPYPSVNTYPVLPVEQHP